MTAAHTLRFMADHPAFAGHFPGIPILPGALLLDAALHAAACTASTPAWQIVTAKFHNVVSPGEVLALEHERLPEGLVRFSIRSATQLVASGTLRPSTSAPAARGPSHGQ